MALSTSGLIVGLMVLTAAVYAHFDRSRFQNWKGRMNDYAKENPSSDGVKRKYYMVTSRPGRGSPFRSIGRSRSSRPERGRRGRFGRRDDDDDSERGNTTPSSSGRRSYPERRYPERTRKPFPSFPRFTAFAPPTTPKPKRKKPKKSKEERRKAQLSKLLFQSDLLTELLKTIRAFSNFYKEETINYKRTIGFHFYQTEEFNKKVIVNQTSGVETQDGYKIEQNNAEQEESQNVDLDLKSKQDTEVNLSNKVLANMENENINRNDLLRAVEGNAVADGDETSETEITTTTTTTVAPDSADDTESSS